MDINNEAIIANNNLKNAGEKLSKVQSSVSEMLADMRNSSRDFYYRLALLAGGILSLDITFIGYLASKSATLHYSELLFLSWIFLLIGLIGALYRNHYNLDMGHYQITNSLNKVYLEQYQAKLALLKIHPASFINLKTKNDVEEDIAQTEKSIKTVGNAIKNNEKKEKMNNRSWLIAQRMAHIGFVTGLILTTLFASLNLPIKLDFTIWNFFTSVYK